MNQNQNPQIDDTLSFCPSFNCYTTSSSSSSPSAAAAAAIKISNSLSSPDHDNESEFNFVIEDDRLSNTLYPVFNQKESCENTLQKLFITEREEDQEPDTSSSSDDDEEGNEEGNENENENENLPVFCVWKGKSDTSSDTLAKCKKSRSTGSGSGSKRWRIRDYLLRRSNSEGKEAVMLVNNNKKVVEKMKRNSVEGGVNNGRYSPSVHEMFYVQNRAKAEEGKRRSYLPYRQGLVGFFTNGNGSKGKSFPF